MDPAVVVQNKDLQADARHLTIAGAHHLPVELDDLVQARGVVPGPETVDAVLGPQLGDVLASPFGVEFDPHRHVAVGQLLGVDHNVLRLS